MGMKKTFAKADILNINGGAVRDQFEECLRAVLANIADGNTDGTKVRGITIKIDFKPKADRSGAETKVSSSVKLASVLANVDSVFFDNDGDKTTAYFVDPAQPDLPEVPKNAVPLVAAGGKS